MNRFLRLAHELTKYSTAKNQRMAAVVVRGGSVLSTGVNRNGNCAEKRAIRPYQDLSGATIYVMRSNGLCSRPCHKCQAFIARAGLRRAVFVDWNGQVASERYA